MSNPVNILLIHTDQHRFDCLGATGNPDVRTPNIDALAGEGVVFDQCFCPYPVCTPSRYSTLTGLYPHQHLGWTNHSTIPQGLPTLPRQLRDAGWQTTAVGKMHFTPTYLDVGFQTMRLAEQNGPGRYDDDYHRWLIAEGLCPKVDLMDQEKEFRAHATPEYWETFGALESDLDEEHHSTTWVAEQALADIDAWDGSGNMLMVGFVKPHHPFDPPAPWSRSVDPDGLTLLPGWTEQPLERDLACSAGYFPHKDLSEAALRHAMGMYYATISQIDHHVGRMIERLQRKGLYDRTLIVVTSDHGDFMGFHHLLLKGNLMYDPLVKVPLIVRWPGEARQGVHDPRLVSGIDLAPTLLRSAGVSVPDTMNGLDLADPGSTRDAVFTEDRRGAWIMVRTPHRKLLQGPSQRCLFDLDQDPLEMEDRSDDPAYADDLASLEQRLNQWYRCESAPPTHLDEHAPVIEGENVLRQDDARRRDVADIFRRNMAESGVPPSQHHPFP